MKRHRNGFQQCGFGERKTFRQAMNDACRHHDKLGKRSRATVVATGDAQNLAAIAEINVSVMAGRALATIDRRVKGDAITLGPAAYVLADGCDCSRGFVSHHDRGDATSRRAVVAVAS